MILTPLNLRAIVVETRTILGSGSVRAPQEFSSVFECLCLKGEVLARKGCRTWSGADRVVRRPGVVIVVAEYLTDDF